LTSIWGGVWCHLAGDFVVGQRGLTGTICAHQEMIPSRPSAHHAAADRHYYGTEFEATPAAQRLRLLHPARQGEHERPGAHLFKPLRQTIESINQTFKSQLHLERHGGHTPTGVMVRILPAHSGPDRGDLAQRPHRRPVHRSLTAYDH
jgi:hypothetical protein